MLLPPALEPHVGHSHEHVAATSPVPLAWCMDKEHLGKCVAAQATQASVTIKSGMVPSHVHPALTSQESQAA